MYRGRKFAHIYEINSLEVKAYLLPGTDSLIQAHTLGVSKIARIGAYAIINSGGNKLIGIINALHATDPEKLYWLKTSQEVKDQQIIRTVTITLIGQFSFDEKGNAFFERGIYFYPSIDEEVLVPTQHELDLILNERIEPESKLLEIGEAYTSNDVRIKVDPVKLFSRHCAVVGSTGNGKSCTVTVLIQELRRQNIKLPIFIFDVNGEYSRAFRNDKDIRIMKFGGEMERDIPREDKAIKENILINYSSLSRRTWRNILKPSERTQIPALNFAIDILHFLPLCLEEINIPSELYAAIPDFINNDTLVPLGDFLCGDPAETDGELLDHARRTIEFLMLLSSHPDVELNPTSANSISMNYLAKAITDRWAIMPARGGTFQMDAFRYSNVSHLCDRIIELSRDSLFKLFCDVDGKSDFELDEVTRNVERINGQRKRIFLTIFDLSAIPQEYLPIFVDSLLEQNLLEALRNSFRDSPRLLVLDEAHHYLGKRGGEEAESSYLGNTPGDRIAKEGRKYGLHLLVATQRPAELSDTLVAQVGTIISHALTNEGDRHIVNAFGNYSDRTILAELSILPRREAIMIGDAISMPTRVKVTFLPEDNRPNSKDPLEGKI